MKLDDTERELDGLVIEGKSVVDRSRHVENVSIGEAPKGPGNDGSDDAVFVGGSLVVDGDALEADQNGQRKWVSRNLPEGYLVNGDFEIGTVWFPDRVGEGELNQKKKSLDPTPKSSTNYWRTTSISLLHIFKRPSSSTSLTGTFKNFNTLEEFKGVDVKKEMFAKVVDKVHRTCLQVTLTAYSPSHNTQILHSFTDPRSTPLFNPFLLLTFSDLKKYKFHYWFAFPALVSDPSWEYVDDGGMEVYEGEAKSLVDLKDRTGLRGEGFLLKGAGSQQVAGEIKHWTMFFEGIPENEVCRPSNDRSLVIHNVHPSSSAH
jgi:hypothetical protein